mgnify:CR=1 FL=1
MANEYHRLLIRKRKRRMQQIMEMLRAKDRLVPGFDVGPAPPPAKTGAAGGGGGAAAAGAAGGSGAAAEGGTEAAGSGGGGEVVEAPQRAARGALMAELRGLRLLDLQVGGGRWTGGGGGEGEGVDVGE